MQQAKMGNGSEPVLQKTKARGTWLGLFQWCIAKPLKSKCPSVVGKVKSILHSQDFCSGEAAWNTWDYRTGEMLLTLQPAYGNVQFPTKGTVDTSCDNSKWH